MFSIKGRIVTLYDIIDGHLTIENGRITDVRQGQPERNVTYDFGGALVVPGFIDLHIHGIGTYEPLNVKNLVGMAQLAVHYGTTAFLPTGAAMSREQYINLGLNAQQAIKNVKGAGAKILGVHLEGPFINPASSGAMAVSTRRPITISEASDYISQIGNMLKIMTISPELEGGIELLQLLRSHGIVAAIGHSMATGEQLASFVDAGLTHVAHMFNAFVPSGEKEPGVLNAGLIEHILLNDALTCEFICDMHHVAPELIKIASKILGMHRFVAVTDSLCGAGLEDGIYAFPDGEQYRIVDNAARLHIGQFAGCLAGSVLTMDRAFANLVEHCDIDPCLAAKYTSTNAARVLGMDNKTGSIEAGKCADIAVLDENYQCIATFVDGRIVHRQH